MGNDVFADLLSLSSIISDSLTTLYKTCKENDLTLPDINASGFDPASEAFRANPKADEACRVIAAAGLQLAMSLLPPSEAMYQVVSGPFKAAALRVALEGNVTEMLREAGPEGLHADDIGEKANVDGMHISRLLRMLASNHIYREVRPDVFTNNRISGMMDTGKSVEDLLANPGDKHDNTGGFPALLGHHLDETSKASTFVWETLTDPKVGRDRSGKNIPAPLNYALQEKDNMWQWLEKPENSVRLKRFGVAMQGVLALQPPDAVLKAYDWVSLPEGSVVVDVGGGVGASSLSLAAKYKHLKLIIQDRPQVCENGTALWREKQPDALSSGRVSFMGHDFFSEQPVKEPAAFLLKQILHDWSDVWCYDILKHLRAAAGPHTKLVLIDSIIPYACPVPETKDTVPGGSIPPLPYPLLANGGSSVTGMPQTIDMIMMCLFGAQERTLGHLQQLLKSTGWKLVAVRRDSGSNYLQPAECIPIPLPSSPQI